MSDISHSLSCRCRVCGVAIDAFMSFGRMLIEQSKLSPDAHVPGKPNAEFAHEYLDRPLIFAWNHAAEIRQKEQALIAPVGDGSSMFRK